MFIFWISSLNMGLSRVVITNISSDNEPNIFVNFKSVSSPVLFTQPLVLFTKQIFIFDFPFLILDKCTCSNF